MNVKALGLGFCWRVSGDAVRNTRTNNRLLDTARFKTQTIPRVWQFINKDILEQAVRVHIISPYIKGEKKQTEKTNAEIVRFSIFGNFYGKCCCQHLLLDETWWNHYIFHIWDLKCILGWQNYKMAKFRTITSKLSIFEVGDGGTPWLEMYKIVHAK